MADGIENFLKYLMSNFNDLEVLGFKVIRSQMQTNKQLVNHVRFHSTFTSET